ncbi:MAG: hypothetical protein ACXVKA_00615 [Acidimicrobiia bacterium]
MQASPPRMGVEEDGIVERGEPARPPRINVHAPWVPYVLLVVIAFVSVALHVLDYTVVGPKDELQHMDYADKISHFHFPRFPEPIGQRPLGEEACRGLDDGFNAKLPKCDATPYRNQDFQEGGLSTQTFHPPLYYALVGFPARAIAAVFGFEGQVGTERALGSVWLAIGLCLALATARRLRANTWATFGLLAGIATTAQVVFVQSTVSNDATAFCVGALAIWAVVRYRGNRAGLLVLALVGFFAGALKITNGFGVGTACLFALFAPPLALAFPVAERWKESLWPRLKIVLSMAGGYILANAIWAAVFEATQYKAPRELSIFNRFAPKELTLQIVLNQVWAYANPFARSSITSPGAPSPAYIPKMFSGPLMSTTGLLVTLAVLAAAYSSWMFLFRERDTAAVLGACVSSLLLLGGPLQFLFVYFATSAGYTETRYSFSMLPAIAIVGGLLATRTSARVLVAIGTASVLATVGVGLGHLIT